MNTMIDNLERLGACEEAIAYARTQPDPISVIKNCTHISWLSWLDEKANILADSERRLMACWFVRNTPLADGRKVWDLLTDERSRNAVEVAERFANGEATREELAAAGAAAWAAARAAAWDAARAAAWDAARAAAWAAARAAARDAAGDAAWDAARAAAWAAARDAAGDAAWDAARAAAWAAAWAAAGDAQRIYIVEHYGERFAAALVGVKEVAA